jgi:hypothetical protein
MVHGERTEMLKGLWRDRMTKDFNGNRSGHLPLMTSLQNKSGGNDNVAVQLSEDW